LREKIVNEHQELKGEKPRIKKLKAVQRDRKTPKVVLPWLKAL
jgi:hypothetical protein